MEEQEVKNKRIARNAIILYVRMIFLLLISFYTSRVTLDIFGVEDFGLYNLVGGIITITVFISSSMALSAERFLAYAIGKNDKNRLADIFSMLVTIHLIIAAIILVLGETIGLWFVNTQLVISTEKIMAANVIYQSSIFSFLLTIISTPYNSIIIAHEQMNYFSLVSILQGLLKLIIVLILPFVAFDQLITYTLLMTTPAVLYFIMNYLYARHQYDECLYHHSWSKHEFHEMVTFAGYSTFGNMATAVVSQGQSVLLNLFYGPALNAVRGLATQITFAINSFVNSTYTAVNPQIIKSYAQEDYDYFRQLIFNATKIGFTLLFMLSLPVFIETDFVLSIWLKEVPSYTAIFVRILLINALLYNFVVPSWMAIQATGNVIKIHLVTGCINLTNLLITYLLWKHTTTEPYIIYIINIGVSLCMQIATIIIQRQQLQIKIWDYLKTVVFPVLTASAISTVIPIYIYQNMQDGILRFMVVTLASIGSCLVSFYLFVPFQRPKS